MPKGDVRPTLGRGSGGWGGSGYYSYDDQGRGGSKHAWDNFFDGWSAASFAEEWLYNRDDYDYHFWLKNSVRRYRLLDIAFHRSPGYELPYDDTRAHRLVIKKHSEDVWLRFHTCLVEGYERQAALLKKEWQERADAQNGKHDAWIAQRDALRAEAELEDWKQIADVVQPTVGLFESEINSTFVPVNKVGDSGDYIDDVVEVYQGGSGWGYESRKAVGTKLQVTISLDLSNSMYYNKIHQVAANTFRDISIVLENMRAMYPDDLYTAYFTFSDDGWSWDNNKKYGRKVTSYNERRPVEGETFGDFNAIRPSKVNDWVNSSGIFEGTDTWISPLFETIEEWEKEHSDPGAMRLDIIITDAVLEHPKDIRDADVIQERRDGALQSVFLNFMPEEDWLNSTLPRRCFEVGVSADNVAGILRNILSEFLAVSI